MPVVVTERWSDRKYQPQKKAERAWDVTGVSSESEAILAVGDACFLNATFPLDFLLYAEEPEVTRTGPASYRVHSTYTFDTKQDKKDPPSTLPRFKWATAYESAPTDVDADGHALLNSAGFPFSSDPGGDFPYRVLTVTRYESSYDLGLAEAYENATNSDAVSIPRAGSVEPGRILFKTYEPTTDYDVSTNYLKNQYTFWLRRGNVKDADGVWDPFKHRLLDAGLIGWYSDGGSLKSGPFVHVGSKNPVSEPVLLDGSGRPIQTGKFLVQDATGSGRTPAAYQTLAPQLVENSGSAVFLKYRKHKPMPFSGLALFH